MTFGAADKRWEGLVDGVLLAVRFGHLAESEPLIPGDQAASVRLLIRA